jgi:hypothetical protein
MRSHHSLRQLHLDVGEAPVKTGRNARLAERTQRIAEAASNEARERLRAGDAVGAREAFERATAAKRAAKMLREGPGAVREVLGPVSHAA